MPSTVMGRFVVCLATLILLIDMSGCQPEPAAIDVDRAFELISDDNNSIKLDSIEILTAEFGPPNTMTSAQRNRLDKMEEDRKKMFESMPGRPAMPGRANSPKRSIPKPDYSEYQVWGNNTAFIAVNVSNGSRGYIKIGGSAPKRPNRRSSDE